MFTVRALVSARHWLKGDGRETARAGACCRGHSLNAEEPRRTPVESSVYKRQRLFPRAAAARRRVPPVPHTLLCVPHPRVCALQHVDTRMRLHSILRRAAGSALRVPVPLAASWAAAGKGGNATNPAPSTHRTPIAAPRATLCSRHLGSADRPPPLQLQATPRPSEEHTTPRDAVRRHGGLPPADGHGMPRHAHSARRTTPLLTARLRLMMTPTH